MFNIFKKKIAISIDEDQRLIGTKLADQTKLETILEKGKLAGFTVIIQMEKNDFIIAMKHHDSYTAFIGVIENQIKEKYIDAFINSNNKFAPKEKEVNKAKRIVCTQNFDVLFHWSKGS